MWEKCGKELRGNSGKDVNLVCFRSSKNLLIQKIEILSLRPLILQYHNMVHRRLAKRAVLEAEALQLEQLRISGKTETPEKSQVRAANGTWLIHTKRPNFARMFWNLQANIRALDLSTAEPWQILSYNSEGYYAPHYDFLNPETNKVLVESRGNRIATVLVILQIAKKGGTTVFPKININIRPKIGDVVVWLNTVPDGESDSQTLHAACPIKEGTKIAMIYKLFLFSLFFLLPLAFSDDNSSYTSNEKDSFEGDEYWDEQYLDLCDNVSKDTTWQWRRAVCFEYLISFQAVKVEVISWSPGLVIYRDLFTKKQVHDYLEIMKHQDFEEQQVVNDDGTEYYSKYRKANGTQIIAQDFPAALSIWKTVKNLIPTLNIESSEDIVALSYIRGGHYAAHHDFLEYPSEKEWDGWMKDYGNRFGTLIMAFETAKLGGATIFPSLNAAIRPNPGDAFFWFNAMGNTKQEDLSDHGGCPIYKGKKSISTIWFRMKNQPILTKLLNPGHISARWLIPDHF